PLPLSPTLPLLLPLSAHSPEAVKSLAQAYQNFLGSQEFDVAALQDICYTASVRRTHHEHRLAVVVNSPAQVKESLQNFVQGNADVNVSFGRKNRRRRPKVAFVFSGQGPQWWAMGRELLEQEPVFRSAMEQCDELIKSHTGWSVLEELTKDDASQSRLQETEFAQPAIFALQVALAQVWRSWGIDPDAVVGHSLGEVAAARISGALTLEEAVYLICHRGRLMQQATGHGKMAAIELSAKETERLLSGYEDRLTIAAINSPTSTVISGEPFAVESVLKLLQQEQPEVFCKLLPVNYAFHSPQMAHFAVELVQHLHQLQPHSGTIPFFSTVTGQMSHSVDLDATYWGRNLEQSVRFADAIEELANAGQTIFIEVSPHPVLSGYISQCLNHLNKEGTVLPSLRRGQPERTTLLSSLGNIYTQGYPVNWQLLYPSANSVVSLPSYPWQRQRYWFERKHQKPVLPTRDTSLHPLLGQRLRSPLKETLFESELSVDLQPFLVGHQIYGMVVLPGAGYLEIALAGAAAVGLEPCCLQAVSIQEPLILPENSSRVVQLILTPLGDGQTSFRIVSVEGDRADDANNWVQHTAGKVNVGQSNPVQTSVSLKDLQARIQEQVSIITYYQQLQERGLEYGSSFQGIEQLWRYDGEVLGRIRLPEALVSEATAYHLHPVLMDSGFQLLFAALASESEDDTYLPVGLDNLRLYRRADTQLWIHGQIRRKDNLNQEALTGDLRLFDDAGKIVAEIEGFHVKRAKREMLLQFAQKNQNLNHWLYEVEWRSQARETNLQHQVNSGSWLLFADREGIAAEVAKLLKNQGDNCFMVFPGEAYEVSEEGHYKINPESTQDFQKLFNEVLKINKTPLRGVAHLWGLDSSSEEAMTVDSLKVAQTLGSQSVLHLVQELAKVDESVSPRLWLVTRGTQPVESQTTSEGVAHSTLWGLGRVISLEHPEIWGGMVDLETGTSEGAASLLFAEISQPNKEDHIVFRGEQRYVARLVPSSHTKKAAEPLSLRKDATYLITGGLGSLGLQLAGWMVQQGARYLVLVGRSGASETTREVLKELERSGVKVLVAKGDVSQQKDVARILGEISESMPVLRGVIHAAGILDDGVLLQQEWERFNKVMAPKVEGAWNLHLLTQNLSLDYFVMFSSVASLLGSPGQGNYAAANAFLDALAHYRRAQGLPGLSINWSFWANMGMAAGLDGINQNRLAAMGMETIAPTQGLQVLEQLLQESSTQVGVIPVNWMQFMQQFTLDTAPPLLTEFTRGLVQVNTEQLTVPKLEFLLKLKQVLARDRQELLLAHIQDQVTKVLGLTSSHRIEAHQGFFDLGMDSLTSMELRNRLQASLGHALSSTLIFDYPTLNALATYLAGEMFSEESHEEDLQVVLEKNHQQAMSVAEIEQLSEEDAEALLLKELESIKF
ncbi:hypothetical protein WA1_26500, partial [Scytonema hofmannii PCC 7110]